MVDEPGGPSGTWLRSGYAIRPLSALTGGWLSERGETMFESRKTTAVPRKDSVEASARAGRPGVPEDRTRPRSQWVLLTVVAVLSAGLQTAIVMSLHGRIARGKELVAAPSRALRESFRPRVPRTWHRAAPRAAPPREARSRRSRRRGGPGAGRRESPRTRTVEADDEPRPPAGLAGPSRPVEDAPVPAADPADLGRELFARTWRPDDPRCHGGDGLGPVYNAASCLDCHSLGGPGGAGPVDQNVELATGIGYLLSPQSPIAIIGQLFGEKPGLDMVPADPDPADLMRIHPGFRDATSARGASFGVDPDYSRWRATFRSQSRPVPTLPTLATTRPQTRPVPAMPAAATSPLYRRRATGRFPSRGKRGVTPGGTSDPADRKCDPSSSHVRITYSYTRAWTRWGRRTWRSQSPHAIHLPCSGPA